MPDALPKTLKTSPPSYGAHLIMSFPRPHILLLTLNRPNQMNSITSALERDLGRVLDWFETEPDLWVVIVTGAGHVFCAGADLKGWKEDQLAGTRNEIYKGVTNTSGFGSLSRRRSNKSIIAAVNGDAFGGGVEIILNSDLVVASEKAKLGLPEARVGVIVGSGGIQRLLRVSGHQRAAELLLTGKPVSAIEARDRFGFVNLVVPANEVVAGAIKLGEFILESSPDAIRSTKRAINESTLHGNVEDAFRTHLLSTENQAVFSGENIKEGLKAFVDRRRPNWTTPKL